MVHGVYVGPFLSVEPPEIWLKILKDYHLHQLRDIIPLYLNNVQSRTSVCTLIRTGNTPWIILKGVVPFFAETLKNSKILNILSLKMCIFINVLYLNWFTEKMH